MNRFKSNAQENKTEDHCRRKDEIQLLNLLDRCTQVLRDDRIWLRNKVKEGDRDIIQIFKKHLAKKPFDLALLQTSLRKHVMRIKDKCKKDQLQKFKQNMQLGTNNIFERHHFSNQRSSKSIPFKKQEPQVMYFEEEDEYSAQRAHRNRNHHQNRQYPRMVQEEYYKGYEQPSSKRQNLSSIAKIKMTDPIEEEDYQLEQGISYRSKGGHNRNKTTEKQNSQKMVYEERRSLPWQNNNNHISRNVECVDRADQQQEYGQDEEQSYQDSNLNECEGFQPFQEQNLKTSNSKHKHEYEPPLLPRQKAKQHVFPWQQKNKQFKKTKNQVLFGDNSYRSNSGISYLNNQTDFIENKNSHPPQLTLQIPAYLSSNQPVSFSVTPVIQKSKQKHISFNQSNMQEQSSESHPLINSISRSQYSKEQESLFTSPELLLECRRFLQQSNQKLQSSGYKAYSLQNSVAKTIHQPGFLEASSSYEQLDNFKERFVLGQKRDIIESVELRTQKSNQMESGQNRLQSQIQSRIEPISLEKEMLNTQSNKISDISQLYAEQVFQMIFPDLKSSISYQKYTAIILKRFAEAEKMIRLFKVADKNMSNSITASEFGKLLLSNCNYKPSPNPVKEIFTLIDIDRKGFFTLDDFEKFLEQVIDADDPQTPTILETCERLFQSADVGGKKRVDYWGFYLTRNTQEFEDFSVFLEQFEFELEIS